MLLGTPRLGDGTARHGYRDSVVKSIGEFLNVRDRLFRERTAPIRASHRTERTLYEGSRPG